MLGCQNRLANTKFEKSVSRQIGNGLVHRSLSNGKKMFCAVYFTNLICPAGVLFLMTAF
jgi:hypothetical protein